VTVSTLLKTSGPGSHLPVFKFVSYSVKKLCVRELLTTFLSVTQGYRVDDLLLLSLKEPYAPVSTQTVSRWLKEILKLSGIDTKVFTAHSCRPASTSKAFAKGCTVDTIFNRAGWTKESNTVAKFYHREVMENDTFQDAVLS